MENGGLKIAGQQDNADHQKFSRLGSLWNGSRSGREDFRSLQILSERRTVFANGSDASFFARSQCYDCRSLGTTEISAAFINKIDEAMGEATETQAWLDHALDCDYLDRNQHRALDEMWQKVGAMLNRMIQRADGFCRLAGR